MRDALASLTTRGRTFLAAGTTTVVCGLVLGQWVMTQLGLVAVLLPLGAAFFLSRSQHHLTLQRTVTPRLVVAGQSATVQLRLANDGKVPSGTLLLEEVVPYALGQRPRFVLEGVGRGWSRDLAYPVRSEVRGRHVVGPMTVRVTDPFGMVEMGRTFHSTTDLVATPRTVALTSGDPAQAWAGSGHSRPRSFSVGHAEDVTVREYQQGDDVRRVHWPSSARTDELMVRREEQPWQARTVVVLDTRTRAHRGRGSASSFETAVSAAASLAVHLAEQGHEVQVATATGLLPVTVVAATSSAHGHEVTDILEALAVVDVDSIESLDVSWLMSVPTGTQVAAVLGALDTTDHYALARLERHSSPRALVLDVDAWTSTRRASGASAAETTLAGLSASGWRAALLGPGDDLDTVWKQVAR
ncbi:DUF58 domain-containing protein [Nocardioides daphniae]|uniref:DUF58 domain-containing protein n=1 Tax=Nocardioides daphniae TaxID=402297 RepID=UPI003607DEDC